MDHTTALLDDTVRRRQAEPGSLADLLGREIRFAESRARAVVHAAARVSHRQPHVWPGLDLGVLIRAGLIALGVGGFDGQFSAIRHGIAGIQDKVHQHLLDLSGIGHHPAKAHGAHNRKGHVFTQQPAQHPFHSADDLVQVQHLGLQRLLAAEREELPRESRCAVGGHTDLGEAAQQRVWLVQVLHGQIGVVDDDGEHIVEVMGNPARQAADGVHPLRNPEALLGFP